MFLLILLVNLALAGSQQTATTFSCPPSGKILATVGSPIPTAYSSSNSQSRVVTGMKGKTHLAVFPNGSDICFTMGSASGPIGNDFCIKNGTGVAVDDVYVGDSVYIKSDTGSPITSGDVRVCAW